jgi:hypothetical protein
MTDRSLLFGAHGPRPWVQCGLIIGLHVGSLCRRVGQASPEADTFMPSPVFCRAGLYKGLCHPRTREAVARRRTSQGEDFHSCRATVRLVHSAAVACARQWGLLPSTERFHCSSSLTRSVPSWYSWQGRSTSECPSCGRGPAASTPRALARYIDTRSLPNVHHIASKRNESFTCNELVTESKRSAECPDSIGCALNDADRDVMHATSSR